VGEFLESSAFLAPAGGHSRCPPEFRLRVEDGSVCPLLISQGMSTKETVRIAALGDLHYGRASTPGSLQPLFSQISEAADVLVLCGDLTDYGLAEEAKALVKELTPTIKIPIVSVLGNHDFESNQQDAIRKVLCDAGIIVLDGD